MQRSAILAMLIALSACSSLSEQSQSPLSVVQPGLSNLDTITKQDRDEEKWWGSFYGRKSGGDE